MADNLLDLLSLDAAAHLLEPFPRIDALVRDLVAGSLLFEAQANA